MKTHLALREVAAPGIALLIALSIVAILQGKRFVNAQPSKPNNEVETFKGRTAENGTKEQLNNRTLRLSLTADDPSFLKIKEGDAIARGQVLIDNTPERERLDRQKKSILLQVENIKSKTIPAPVKAPAQPGASNLPPAIFSEEKAAIAQCQLKLSQAKAILEGRTPLLQSDNPQVRAEMERAEAGLQIATQKVQEQEQLIAGMRDMKMQPAILQHEEAKLRQIQSEYEQTRSALDQSKAKLNSSAIEQQQELQQLQLAVKIAESELSLSMSRFTAAQSRRELLEYDANVESIKRSQYQAQLEQEFSRQQQQYAQSIREKDYQLAQLNISLANIEDKLAQIPLVRSPRDGYIRRVKPWIGNNGRYTTTITITSNLSSKNGNSSSASPASSPKTSTNKSTKR
ncbi:hypothetical protein NIES4075_68060 [Tolypothrix sp. NIES-4075]|uniref:hypothetical protein n=1 Tax=Tolypothrix sp. NIES-4075 TaxID=2005459 RepID=UPI000B5CC420|nr:hypothetical protein [Tolypothrix sp. NIES-4075]GAX45785.1 hypothetical protein NIES4075_68060 [Tolypothrix sp. NIES-4075]